MEIGIIGAGRAGSALGTALAAAGHRITAVADLIPERAACLAKELDASVLTPVGVVDASRVILLAVPDGAIAATARQLALDLAGRRGKIFFHLSGACPAGLLAPLAAAGAVGSLHPLLAMAERRTSAARLRRCYYAIEGMPAAVAAGRALVESLGGRLLELDAQAKVRYHAAAVLASNCLVGLVDVILGLYEDLGLDRERAREAVWPLLESTVANIRNLGLEQALTGPISRGDTATVAAHLAELAGTGGTAAMVYNVLSQATVALAARAGRINAEKAREFEELLSTKGDQVWLRPSS